MHAALLRPQVALGNLLIGCDVNNQLILDLHMQRQITSAGQGGHGPGWHSSMHAWPHAGSSGLPQVAPQECGAAQGSNGGSTTLPQKQRYSLGASAAL